MGEGWRVEERMGVSAYLIAFLHKHSRHGEGHHRQLCHMHRCMCISNKLRILEFGADVNLTTGVRLQQLRDRIQLLTQNHILKSRKAMM